MSAVRRLEPYLLAAMYCAVPLATLAADNAALIGLVDLVPYYLVCVGVTGIAIAAVAARRGPAAARIAGMCAAVGVLVVFDYVDMRPVLGWLTHQARPSMVFIWAVLLAGILFGTAWLSGRVPALPSIALVVGLVMLVPPLVRYADARGGSTAHAATHAPTGPVAGRLKERPAPNVYFFLLDAYARPDRMRQQFGFDDGSFVAALREHQFVVPSRTRSVAPITLLSVPAILNMAYGVDPAVSEYVMAGRNRVVATFRHLGYAFELAPMGISGFDCKGYEDLCIQPQKTYATRVGMSDLTWTVLQRTPGIDLMQTAYPPQVSNFGQKRQFPLRAVHAAAAHPRTRPVVLYVHSLLTHTPYPYQGPDCRLQHGEPKRAADYIGAVECANANVLTTVRFITRTDPRAVIVLASDHGTDVGSRVAGVRPGTLDAKRRFSNFVALRLPARCRRDVPEDLAAVNIFRVVMNCVTTARMPLLPYRAGFL